MDSKLSILVYSRGYIEIDESLGFIGTIFYSVGLSISALVQDSFIDCAWLGQYLSRFCYIFTAHSVIQSETAFLG